MSLVIDTGLTSRAVIGRFYRRLEEHAQNAWWTRLAMRFASDQGSETYRWLGMVPQVREWVGGRRVRPLRANGVTIENRVWESTIRVDADEARRDKSGQLLVRVNEMARRVASHPNALISSLIQSGLTAAGYDGVPFFSESHVEGDSGTQSNIVSASMADLSGPTLEEAFAGVMASLGRMLSFRDDAGEPLNDDAREFVVMAAPSLLPPLLSAVRGAVHGATSNPLSLSEPFRVDVIANPRMTWEDRAVLFRTDTEARPFIFQEELPVQVHALAEGSELEINENQHQYGVKTIHAAGYGFWQGAVLIHFV
ncbi:MAG: Mu-like prophage major head subunit gpT family protein [Phycisphaerales bacterium]|nr:Mu-like prophage major head subunit gpT family protein [Phycisphaerales bacterium]